MFQATFVGPTAPKAIKHIKKMAAGGSNSQLVQCNEGDFVVKFKQNPQGKKVLVNELVCAILAVTLLLPCPKGAIVEASPEFIQANQAILSTFSSGAHFGSHYLGEQATATYDSQTIKQAHNFYDLAGIMAFDVWTANTDRKMEHLISYENHVHMIDHGHCFTGPNWTAQSLRTSVNNFDASILKDLVSRDRLIEQAQKIRSLDLEIIQEAVNVVPDEWDLTIDEKKSMVEFLAHRQAAIEAALSMMVL